MISWRHGASCGRNTTPTAYSPGAGSLKPSAADCLAKNLCGVCTRMPAPSPARGSAPTAPRCSRLTRIVSASSTILCDLRPLISAMNPTPQESFSSAGSNRPNPDAFIVDLALPIAVGTARIAAPAGNPVPLALAFGCFSLPCGAPMPTAADPALIPTARFEGSPIGTALLSYVTIANFRHKHKGKALGRRGHARRTPRLYPMWGAAPLLPRASGSRDSHKRNDNRVFCPQSPHRQAANCSTPNTG